MLKRILARTIKQGDCLIWQGCLNSDGYARVAYKGNCNGKAHRIVYQLTHAQEDITDKVIRHSCDNPQCINPKHLLSGTPRENAVDRELRGRNRSSAFTAAQVRRIRKLHKTGQYTNTQLAELFGVNYRTIHQITKHTSYRWVK